MRLGISLGVVAFTSAPPAAADAPSTLKMLEYFNSQSPEPMRWRTREEITALLDGFTILEPGVVFLSQWRPGSSEVEPNPERFTSYTAISRKD